MQPSQPRWRLDEVPLLFPTIGLVGAIALCSSVNSLSLVWGLIAVAVIAICVGIWKRMPRLVLILLSSVVGIVVTQIATPKQIPLGIRVTETGKVVSSCDYGSSQRCVVENVDGARIAVTVYDYPYEVEPGDIVEFSGLLLPPTRETTVPDEQDGSYFAKVNRLSAVTISEGGDFRIVSDATGFQGWLNQIRAKLINTISFSGLSDAAARFVIAIVVGEDRVESEIKDEFAHVGISHILALSGTHVSIVIFLVSFVLIPVEIAGFRRGKQSLMIILLWLYAMLTGMSPSVVRAVVMATFILVGRMTGRYTNSFNSLCGAALMILLFQPMSLFMPGFQLSFLAVAGILMIMPIVRDFIADYKSGHNRVIYGIICWIMLPISAVIATSPLSAWHFHYFPFWFLLANLPIAFLLPLILCGGLLLVVISLLGIHTAFMAEVVGGLYDLLESIAHVVSNFPGGSCEDSLYFSGWILLPIYCGLIMLWFGWNLRRKYYLIMGAILLAGVVGLLSVTGENYPSEECHVWRNSRGVAILCREDNNAYLLTDAAEKYYPEIREQAEARLVDYLAKRDAGLVGIYCDSLTLRGVTVRHDMWQIGGMRFALLREDNDTLQAQQDGLDFLIVARGFRGNILDISKRYRSTPLIISPSLPALRRKRYIDNLNESGDGYLFDIPAAVFTVDSK